MKRATIILALMALTLTGCGFREKREEIKTIDGVDYICTWTHNKISGNESEYTCFPVGEQP